MQYDAGMAKESEGKRAQKALVGAGKGVDAAIKNLLRKRARGPAARMYGMLGYALGYADHTFKLKNGIDRGKRFRSALCLLVAEMYGAREKAFDAALAIELFHNASLIHDDVEDRSAMRRGRPSLWKLCGEAHAINAGDALFAIANEAASAASGSEILFEAFREVIEGQYLDFELSSSRAGRVVSEKQYLHMIERKTAALVRASVEVAGVAAGKSIRERKHLREYGTTIGIAFQIADDYRSIWSPASETRKDAYGDIRERKRALPFIFARRALQNPRELDRFYGLERQLTDREVAHVRTIIDSTNARSRVLLSVQAHAQRARDAAAALSITPNNRRILIELVDALIPEAAPPTRS